MYNPSKGKNRKMGKTLFAHIRNAFAHLYIEISDDQCKLLDWARFVNGRPQEFKASLITMKGNVNYTALKNFIQELLK